MTVTGDQSRTAHDANTRGAHASALQVVVVGDEARLSGLGPAWQELADHAVEANAFYEPWLLLPALKDLHHGPPVRLVFIFETGSPETRGETRLCGFFPLEPDPKFRGLPLRVWRLWKHMHCFLCTPLIRPERAGETLAALLQWADKEGGIHLLDFSYVRGDGPFHDLLVAHFKQAATRQCVINKYSRASWRAGEKLDDYLRNTLSTGIRKEYRRQRKRLAERGLLAFRTLQEPREVEDWLEQFLALEASGWKGREGQALGLSRNQRNFLLVAAQAGFARDQVLLQGLFLNDRPVAMLVSFLAGGGGFAFKIAYDETLAKFSPGVQIVLDILACLHSDSRIAWMDSCAEPNHPMINRLWKDRRVVESVLISTGSWRGDLAVGVFPGVQRLARLIRAVRKTKGQVEPRKSITASRPASPVAVQARLILERACG